MGRKLDVRKLKWAKKWNVQKTECAENRTCKKQNIITQLGICKKWNVQQMEYAENRMCTENRMCKKQNVINQECVKNGMKIYYLICDTVIFGMQKEFNARHDDKEVFYQISFYPLRNANL